MTLTNKQTEQLLFRAAEGSESAVQELLCGHRDRLRSMVRARMDRRLLSRVDPSDVVQDALFKASKKLPDYARQQPIAFYPWLRQIAWERLVDLHRQHIKARKRSVTAEHSTNVELSHYSIDTLIGMIGGKQRSPSEEAIQNERKERMRRAIDLIDPISREVLLLHYVEQMKLREIAETLDLTESAVKSRHIRGLKKLAKIFNDEHER